MRTYLELCYHKPTAQRTALVAWLFEIILFAGRFQPVSATVVLAPARPPSGKMPVTKGTSPARAGSRRKARVFDANGTWRAPGSLLQSPLAGPGAFRRWTQSGRPRAPVHQMRCQRNRDIVETHGKEDTPLPGLGSPADRPFRLDRLLRPDDQDALGNFRFLLDHAIPALARCNRVIPPNRPAALFQRGYQLALSRWSVSPQWSAESGGEETNRWVNETRNGALIVRDRSDQMTIKCRDLGGRPHRLCRAQTLSYSPAVRCGWRSRGTRLASCRAWDTRCYSTYAEGCRSF